MSNYGRDTWTRRGNFLTTCRAMPSTRRLQDDKMCHMQISVAKALFALLLIATLASCGSSRSKGAATSTPANTAKVTPLFDRSGSGFELSPSFSPQASSWTIQSSFSCASIGVARAFVIVVYDSNGTKLGLAANELAIKGSKSTIEHGTGSFHLSINSDCPWHVRVVDR